MDKKESMLSQLKADLLLIHPPARGRLKENHLLSLISVLY